MVCKAASDGDNHTCADLQARHRAAEPSGPRTSPEQTLEPVRLEDLWKLQALRQGWSVLAASRVELSLAQSSLKTYNNCIRKVQTICLKMNSQFPPNNTAVLAECLISISSDSDRPASVIKCTTAALGNVYAALDQENLTEYENIRRLITALIKSSTFQPRKKSAVMPILNFNELFKSWNNETISIKELRMKSISLLALVMMLRPSDLAPNAIYCDENGHFCKFQFTENQLLFKEDGVMVVAIHGNKNDHDRSGFTVEVAPASDVRLCPVEAVRCYLRRTRSCRTPDGPVFISLRQPYGGLSAEAIRQVLNESIAAAGLPRHLYSAKCFRPTGATQAVACGFDPNIVQRIGRWKTTSVFFEHYVHSKVPVNYSDNVLEIKDNV